MGSNLFQNKDVDLENCSERQGEGDPNPSDSALLLPHVAGTTQVPQRAPLIPLIAQKTERPGPVRGVLLCMESSTPSRDTAWGMSEENVEIVRRLYDRFLGGDLESAFAVFDPEIEAYDHDIPES